LIALAVVIFTASPVVLAAPDLINNESEDVPTEVIAEVIAETPPVEAPKAEQRTAAEEVLLTPAPTPKPVVKHPMGCENYKDLYTRVFGSKADVFLKIANKESSCNPMAVGDKHLTYWQNGIEYGMSCGLLQVRYLPNRPNCSEMQDPEANAQYALNLYNSGGFRHWTVCNKGLVNCY